MNCSSCNWLLKPGKRYCTHCGIPIQRLCTQCHTIAEADDVFCGDCGSVLPVSEVATPKNIRPAIVSGKLNPQHDNERRFVTVLFADLVGFTNFSTSKDPEEVSRLVRDLVEIFEPEITSRGGVVDKYEGDAVLARFGAPIAHEDDAEQALMAALALHRRIGEIGQKHSRPDGQPFQLRIGLNTGEVIAGTIDPGGRDYTILGDVVNTSQRFQTAAQPGETVVGELTYRLTRSTFDFEPMGTLALKGKPKPALAYRLSCIKNEPGDGRGFETNADAGPRAGESDFIGRGHELNTLERAYADVLEGHGRLVLISGETGIGKSRLIRHFLYSQNPQRLIVGRAFSFTSEIPNALLGNLITHMLGLHPSETLVQPDETRHRLSELARRTGLTDGYEDMLELALLADALGIPDKDNLLASLNIIERGRTLQRTVKELLCGLSLVDENGSKAMQPLILVLEDVHWADLPSMQAIEMLAESLANYPILLILNSRPEWNPPASWSELTYFQSIKLGALNQSERVNLLHYLLQKIELQISPETEREVLERTGGQPFFMEEMVLALKESQEQAVLTGIVADSDLQVPASVREVLQARIDRLDKDSRRVLQVGAVLGRRFPERLMRLVAAQALSVEVEQVESMLQNLKRQDLLLENRLAQELEYFFKHGLLQEIAYNYVLTDHRQQWHELVGKALEELYTGREEEVLGLLAYHYSRSRNREKAIYYLTRAGEKALSFDAFQDARRYFGQAMQLADTATRIELETRLAQVQIL